MKKIEEMISRLCPEGVHCARLSDMLISLKKEIITKDKVLSEGHFPIINSGQTIQGYYNKYNNDGPAIAVASRGEYAGYIHYSEGKFWAGGLCYPYKSLDNHKYNIKYIYYCLKNKELEIMSRLVSRGGIPAINKSDLDKYSIPLPHPDIQREIVRILDNFTSLQENLEEELKLRQKQYEYYREKLLTFEEGEFEWKTIEKITLDCFSGATPSTKVSEYWTDGDIPWMTSGEVHNRQIYNVAGRITQLGYNNSSTKMVPINSIVIALAGQGKTRGTVAITRIELCTNQSLCALIPDINQISPEYLFYFLIGEYANLRILSAGDGARGGLNLKMVKGYKVPVPSSSRQQEIVSTLDKFVAMIANIKGEIEQRKKQYEYYREKLLTF